MKIKELIALLLLEPQDHQVILAKDGEGNDFSPVSDIYCYMYFPNTKKIANQEDMEELDMAYTENCVVLWPG